MEGDRKPEALRLSEAAPGVWYSHADSSRDRPALGAVLGAERVLMVDSGASAAHARSFVAGLEAATGRRPDLVALTHWHWDHVFGLAALGLPALAHEATAERLDWMRGLAWDEASVAARVAAGEEIEFCATMIAAEHGAARDIRIGQPAIVFAERLGVELGGRRVDLEWIRNDHSDDGVVVLDRGSGLAFLGDIAGPAYYARPVRYRPARVLELFSRLAALPVRQVLEGHGEPESLGAFLRDYAPLTALARAVLDGERDRKALIALAEDAGPREDPTELHRLVAFMLKGADED